VSRRYAWLIGLSACAPCQPAEPVAADAPAGGVGAPPETLRCERQRNFDCFVEVPAGSFLQGAQASDPSAPGYDPAAAPDEGPPRRREVAGFWMHKYEVRASQVESCQQDGACSTDEVQRGGFSNVGREGQGHHPANSITWQGAQQVCRWLGGRLPTEVEWEYAARGQASNRFPWGEEPRCAGLDPSASQSFQGEVAGAEQRCEWTGTLSPADLRLPSPFGLLGMAGNVWEWVDDWYAADAYAHDAAPVSGELRVQRGGGWSSTDPLEHRSAARGRMEPTATLNDVGFRCVWVGERP
jgi:formylglycine-generating enzyme required for sulfatase activity